MSQKLEFLILHCTATPEGREVTKEEIIKWHTAPKAEGGRGWSKVGYTDIIHLDGKITNLTPFDQDDEVDGFEVTNGVRGMNGISRHVVYSGGMNKHYTQSKDTRTPAQLKTLEAYVRIFIARNPGCKIAGHNQFDTKDCPSFNVPEWLEKIGIPAENIYC